MSNADKYPDLWSKFQELQEEKAAILAKSGPLREERDALRAQMAPLEAQLRALDAEIKRVEQPRLFQVDNQIAALAKGMGGKRMSDAPQGEGAE